MRITVSFNLDFPESGDINSVESLLVEAGRRAMAEAVQESVQAYEEQMKACPRCCGDAIRNMGLDQRVLLMSFGRVVISTRRMR